MTSHRSTARRALAVAGLATGLTTGLTLGSATAAQARVLDHEDRTTDVRVAPADSEHPMLTPAPRHRDGDIASVRISNGTVVGIRVTYVDLKRTTGYRLDTVKIGTNERVVRTISLISGPNFEGGELLSVTRANGSEVRCGVTHSADYAKNVLVIHVARSCLSDPRSVRVGYIAASLTRNFRLVFLDDALRDHTASLLLAPKLSDRVWRH